MYTITYPPYDSAWTRTDDAKNEYLIQGDVVFVKLTQEKVGVVDIGDWEAVKGRRWCAVKGRHQYYWATGILLSGAKHGPAHAHRLIFSPTTGMYVDHINTDGLDNRRQNLRACSISENNCNRGRQANNKSGFKGVGWQKKRGNWTAQIQHNYCALNLGLFEEVTDAARAYDRAAIKYHGEFASLNFPRSDYEKDGAHMGPVDGIEPSSSVYKTAAAATELYRRELAG